MVFSEQYVIFVVLAPLATLTTLGIFFYTWRRRSSYVSPALMWLTLNISGWLIFNTLELVAATETYTVLWSQLTYPFIVGTAVSWLVFAFKHTRREVWLRPVRFISICVIPVTTVLLAFTNAYHGLIWKSYDFTPVRNYLAFTVIHGFWFWIHLVHSYGLFVWGAILITYEYFHAQTLYRQQSAWLLVGALTPLLANMIYTFEAIPGLTKDYTCISFAFASWAFAIGIFDYHLLDLRPIARDTVVDGMQDAMVTLDLRGRIVDVNPAALAIICEVIPSVTPENIIGTQPIKVFATWRAIVEEQIKKPMPDIPDAVPCFILQRRFETHAPEAILRGFQTDVRLDLADGSHDFDMRVSPLRDQRNRLTGQTVLLRDITTRIQVEAALRNNMAELQARNEQLDAFAHTVAHDLKNPLNSLMGYSHLLQNYAEQLNPAEQRQYLDNIVLYSRRMGNIVDALLLLASVHRSDQLAWESIDMAYVLSEIKARLANQLNAAQALLIEPETWPAMRSYAPWIEEIWANYISNAIKYGGQPDLDIPPHIELGWEVVEPETSYRFWVKDNGPGLTAEQQAQLFRPFSRLDKERAEGHGLGLSIVQRIVQKLGGDVGVESTPGEGSAFWFTLPANEYRNEHFAVTMPDKATNKI